MMPALQSDLVVTLEDLFGSRVPAGLAALPVPDLTLDSRRVTPGALFLAVPGRHCHGARYAADAALAGAGAIAWEPADEVAVPEPPAGAVAFPVPGLSASLGEIADRYFGRPSSRLPVIGVTGTNGKTTVTHLVAGALAGLGRPAGIIGTLGGGLAGDLEPARLTTPDVVELHRGLARLAGRGATAVAVEISSHAVDQRRIAGVRLAVVAFTNLTRDHLDYHGTMAAYGAAKAALFTAHPTAAAVVNVRDAFGAELAAGLPAGQRVLTVGPSASPRADAGHIAVSGFRACTRGLQVALEGAFGRIGLESPLIGEFNADNLALAFGILLELGVAPEAAARALAGVAAPAGRMEAFPDPVRGVLAVVDYAHTPDALGKALTALREHCSGRLWCVFGCGGERDAGKRPEMGAIAEQLADELVVTDDNPRREDGAAIVAAILGGLTRPHRAHVERDRAAAIRLALREAGPGDAVLIAGKGHEDYQIVGEERRPFSDRTLVAALTGARA
jgi:UDP-N-acetylmuramoyl-L-alanyl-D-glutamate--2,6-diaminopimelate ligase